jgi:hypothetical protein
MAAKTTPTSRRYPILAAGAIVALSTMVTGCRSDYAALSYAQQAHAQQVAAWCYAYLGVTTASVQGQECLGRAWVGVPPGECDINPCTDPFHAFYSRYSVPHHERRGRIEK